MTGKRTWVVVLVAAVVIIAVAVVYIGTTFIPATSTSSQPPPLPPPPPPPPQPELSDCPRSVGIWVYCEVTRVLDGDTLDVEGGIRIRLVLVDAPELSEPGGPEARDYLTDLCLGFVALIDEDADQVGDDPFGRVLAVVYSEGTNANAAMISSGHADTLYEFCSESEFGNEAWTGC